MIFRPNLLLLAAAAFFLLPAVLSAQQLDNSTVVQLIDAAVHARIDHVAEYSVTEHYAVFRNGDETTPAAEMMVKTLYRKDQGKTFTILSQSGSSLLRNKLLGSVLDSEKQMSQPGMRETVLVTNNNYQMKLKSTDPQRIDGRDCLLLDLVPRRATPSLFRGTLWVDAHDFSIVQLEGKAEKSHSFLTGPAQVSRQYANMSGFSMATHAKAVSDSALLGRTTVKIDYLDYQVKLLPN